MIIVRVIRRLRRPGCRSGRAGAVAVSAAAVLVLASCTSAASSNGPAAGAHSGAATVAGGGRIITLTTISTLKSLFNRDAGHPRLLLVLSPT